MTASLFDLTTEPQPKRPTSQIQMPDQEAPIEERFDPSLWWQKRDQARQKAIEEQKQKQIVNPMADSLTVDTYLNRLTPIKEIGQKALAGQIVSSQVQAEYQKQLAAAKAERARQAAFNDAMNSMGDFSGMDMSGIENQGSGAGWGGGGDQGVANVLRAAGFPENLIPTFIGIAHAESSLNPNATHMNSNGTIDQGLFQINSVHKGNSWYPTNPFDPIQSAKAAWAIYNSQGLGAWSVYKSGAYRQFVPASAPPVQNSIVAKTVTVGNQASTSSVGGVRLSAIQKATAYMNSGVGYVWGGNNLKTGVDCSGLVQQVYLQLGVRLPRTAQEQAFFGKKTPVAQLTPGDLVAFNNGGSRGLQVGHIAIYVGNGEIIESYDTGKPARRRKLSASEVSSGYAWGVHLNI